MFLGFFTLFIGFLFFSLVQSSTLDRDKKKKKKFTLFNKTGDKRETQSGDDSEIDTENLEPILSYELVEQHESKKNYLRMNNYHRSISS